MGDPQVLGFAIFNVGDSDGMWKSFDVTDILPRLAELIGSKEPELREPKK